MENSNVKGVNLPQIYHDDPLKVPTGGRRLGITAGLLSAAIGALLWGIFTAYTGSQGGYFAVIIGVIVGLSVRMAGSGCSSCFIVIGGMSTVIGAVVGNYLSIVGLFAYDQGKDLFSTWGQLEHSIMPSIVCANFQIRDIIYFSIAAFVGARLAKASIYFKGN